MQQKEKLMQQIDTLTGTKTAGKPTTTTGIWAPAPKQEAKPTSMLGANSLLAKLYEGNGNDEMMKTNQSGTSNP